MVVAVAVVLLAGAGAAAAHHSFAMYEATKVVTVEGTVKEFKWANPHVLLVVAGVADGVTEMKDYTMELPAPGQVMRNGWTHATLKAGDKVKVEMRPFRNGKPGGAFVNVTTADGTKIGR